MPILINEVVAELEPASPDVNEIVPTEDTVALSQSEYEIFYTFSVMDERRQRLMVD